MINKRKWYDVFIYFILFISVARIKTNIVHGATLDTISLKNISKSLSQTLNTTSYEELGIHFIEQVYKSFKYTPIFKNADKFLKKFSNKLESKLNETFTLLNQTRNIIEKYKLYRHSSMVPCGNDSYNINIPTENISKVLYDYIEAAKNSKGIIKESYYLSVQDIWNMSYTTNYVCKVNHLLLWNSYISRFDNSPKHILLLLSNTASITDNTFKMMKVFVKSVISLLNSKDSIGIVVFSDTWCSPSNSDQCLFTNQGLYLKNLLPISKATDQNKNVLNRFIDSLLRKNGTENYTLGYEQAFNAIRNGNISAGDKIMLLHLHHTTIFNGKLSDIMKVVRNSISNIQNQIIINACAIISDGKVTHSNLLPLEDITNKNFEKYGLSVPLQSVKGKTVHLKNLDDIALTIVRLFKTLNFTSNFNPNFNTSLPIWDSLSKDLIISVTVPCGYDRLFGILGINLYFSSLVEDITYFNNYPEYFYAFVIDVKGVTLMHPTYPRPTSVSKQIKFVDIKHLEKYKNFESIRDKILTNEEGEYTLLPENLIYNCKRVLNVYIICIIYKKTGNMPNRPHKVRWFAINKLISHRLDIVPPANQCRHLNQIATLDAGSLYLSASSYQSPYSYFNSKNNASATSIQRYMAYFKDSTHLISKPDLREEVRDDVAALAQVLNYLHNQHLTGSKAMYIVRRYVASPSGVLQLYPGTTISAGFEPTKRIWYLTAVEHKYTTILTPPYLDEGGAGYIVTIAYATSHIVTAIDVTYGYIYKLLSEHISMCGDRNIKCFMMDDRGYLIYHQNLIDPNGHGPIEQQHIIHKESLVANDILNRNNILRKTVCNNFADGTTQRYYKLNLSASDVIENTVHGEQCIKYQISTINGTNIFIGIVNATCEVFATFCPCSVVDRLCLNCNRMEPRECECPCECPLNIDSNLQNNTDNPVCSQSPEREVKITGDTIPKNDLKSCFPTVCEQQLSFKSCLGVIGCEWCQFDVDGESLLNNPFCSPILTCFNGILGSPTPYGDATKSFSSLSDDFFQSSYSPIGAVIGSIIGIGLVLVLLFFCYRCHNSSNTDRFYFTSTQDNPVQMTDRNNSDDYHEVDNQQNKLLQDKKKSEPISPYYVSTSYRRPVTTAESDYGYSTMTPHDESEHLSLAPIEIDSLEDDTSDATSINTSVSSKVSKLPLKNKPILQFSHLKDRNCIIAPVTVHRNMDTVE